MTKHPMRGCGCPCHTPIPSPEIEAPPSLRGNWWLLAGWSFVSFGVVGLVLYLSASIGGYFDPAPIHTPNERLIEAIIRMGDVLKKTEAILNHPPVDGVVVDRAKGPAFLRLKSGHYVPVQP